MSHEEYPQIITSIPSLDVPEGGQATFNVKLSSRPGAPKVDIDVQRIPGGNGISIASGAALAFDRKNYNRWQTVTLAASQGSSFTGGQVGIRLSGDGLQTTQITAIEVDRSQAVQAYQITTDRNAVTVARGATAGFNVKLDADPGQAVAVTIGRQSGDAEIAVASGSTYYFDSSNWDMTQPVTLAASADEKPAGDRAIFAVSAPGTDTVFVTAAQQEAGIGNRIVIDPVSRIEGHLRVEVEVSNGAVAKAWSSATLYRGIETILTGRAPQDAPLITQRLCGVCTYVHQLCSVRAIEDATTTSIPDNARIVRNLTLGAQYLHDHIVHFFHLHGLDWVDITSALSADPTATENLANTVSPSADPIDFAAVRSRLQGLVDTGNLGPFANAYWGHTDYNLTPEENLLVSAHYLSGLEVQIIAARMMAILGGKNPHPQSTIVGGVTCGGELAPDRLATFRNYLAQTRRFIQTVYLPDLKVVASRYPAWTGVGGFTNFLACGEFQQGISADDLLMPAGIILNGDILNVQPLDEAAITEHVARSWYAGTADLHPLNGQTVPGYTGLDVEDRYSWFKAPRYDGAAMEVGPLARVLVGYGLGRPDFVNTVQDFLLDTGLSEADLLSTLGRTAARALETSIVANAMETWLNQLESNLSSGDKEIYRTHVMSDSAGRGLLEAPRGALGHWIDIQGSATNRYQMVVPTTWNLGPRCADNIAGPMEQALVGVPVADPENPMEILRVIHSFDPCIACGVHVIDMDKRKAYDIKVI
ncbi:MAG: nickel-dependent hydrogenase large subunit [Desulfobacter sp.]